MMTFSIKYYKTILSSNIFSQKKKKKMYTSFPNTLLFHFGLTVEPYHKIRARAVLRTRYAFKSSNSVVFDHFCVVHVDLKAGACSGVKVFWIIVFTFLTHVLNSWLVNFGCHFEWLFKYWWIDFIFTGYLHNKIVSLKKYIYFCLVTRITYSFSHFNW